MHTETTKKKIAEQDRSFSQTDAYRQWRRETANVVKTIRCMGGLSMSFGKRSMVKKKPMN